QEDTLAKMTARTWGLPYAELKLGPMFLMLPAGIEPERIPNEGKNLIRLKNDFRKIKDLENHFLTALFKL
ncbi:hypothetical protein ACVGWF_00045, partial [Enterobacter asburiae]